jgi:8-amino-7-oxononanoate synthase
LGFLEADLAAAEASDLLRPRAEPWTGAIPSFCSNDYLGLGAKGLAVEDRAGAGASRLITGEQPAHRDAERLLATWVGLDDALLFTSGYAANLGLLSSLARAGDVVVSDALNHASIIDGARLSKARVVVTPHGDLDAVERALGTRTEARAFVAVESYFSMDADSPDLGRLRALTTAHGAALLVDEAHALGVLGPNGRGLCAAAGIVPDALIGTLGKAIGVQGGFVAGSRELTLWLWNRARSFVFSTGASPLLARAVLASAERARAAEADREHVRHLADRLRRGLGALGLDVRGYGHIVPWVVGSPKRAIDIANALRHRGFDVRGIRPPTVPDGSSRLRLTVTAAHDDAAIDALLDAIGRVSRET